MIKIATAECFTHGLVGREIHAFSRGYPSRYPWSLDPEKFPLSLVAGLFIPTLSGVRSILHFEPLPPRETLNDIKVYDQQGDEAMALKMAEAIREITRSHIGIGTTAGIGRGGIALVADDVTILATSEEYADLRTSDPTSILKRQRSGIQTTLQILEGFLTEGALSLPDDANVHLR